MRQVSEDLCGEAQTRQVSEDQYEEPPPPAKISAVLSGEVIAMGMKRTSNNEEQVQEGEK